MKCSPRDSWSSSKSLADFGACWRLEQLGFERSLQACLLGLGCHSWSNYTGSRCSGSRSIAGLTAWSFSLWHVLCCQLGLQCCSSTTLLLLFFLEHFDAFAACLCSYLAVRVSLCFRLSYSLWAVAIIGLSASRSEQQLPSSWLLSLFSRNYFGCTFHDCWSYHDQWRVIGD